MQSIEGSCEKIEEILREVLLPIYEKLIAFDSTFGNETPCMEFVESTLKNWGFHPIRVPHSLKLLERHPDSQPPLLPDQNRFSLALRLAARGQSSEDLRSDEGSSSAKILIEKLARNDDPTGSHASAGGLILNAHVDVVPAQGQSGWDTPPFNPHWTEDQVTGRGSFDDKAGVLEILGLLYFLSQNPHLSHRELVIHFVIEDETTGNGSMLCLEQGFTAPFAIIIDGTRRGSAIERQALWITFVIEALADPVSVSVSHLTCNPVLAISEFYQRLAHQCALWNQQNLQSYERFPNPNRVNVIEIQSSPSFGWSVPGQALAKFHLIVTPGRTITEVRKTICELAQDIERALEMKYPFRIDWNHHAVEGIEPSDLGAQEELKRQMQEAFAEKIDFGPSTGTSDLRHFFKRSIAACLYGPGRGGNPHRPNEFFAKSDFVPMIWGLIRLACGSDSEKS